MTQTEALKQARSVISSINQGKQHRLTMNDENVFWQREEWVRWALDEVLPLIEEALAQPERGLKPRCFSDFQQKHEHDRKCKWCAVEKECKTVIAQTEQEPVACASLCVECTKRGDWVCAKAIPPQRTWVGLTDADRNSLYEAHHNKYNLPNQGSPDGMDYERAIEAKLKEKNK